MWEAGASPALMSAAERGAYEEKKLKMRKAMGENLADDVAGEAPDARQRRWSFTICDAEAVHWCGVPFLTIGCCMRGVCSICTAHTLRPLVGLI